MSSETTPLVPPSGGGGSPSSYYFLQQADKKQSFSEASVKGQSEHGEIDVLPVGTSKQEFAPREVGTMAPSPRVVSRQKAGTSSTGGGLFQKFFGGKKNTGFEPATGGFGTLVKERKAPIKIEPKVFFANERTFLAWLHTSILLAGASIAIVAFADANPWSQLYGVILLPIAIAFIIYAMYQYTKRAAMIRRREPGPYEDIIGPTVLGIMLMLSIVAQFSIKLYSLQ